MTHYQGFVVRWAGGFRAKVKLEEYKRLHRLITQCSTRTIWEMLRIGASIQELLDRVPKEFAEWVCGVVRDLSAAHKDIDTWAQERFSVGRPYTSRKDFAVFATKEKHPSLLFSLLDGKDITDSVWKLVEPRWATPFRKDIDA